MSSVPNFRNNQGQFDKTVNYILKESDLFIYYLFSIIPQFSLDKRPSIIPFIDGQERTGRILVPGSHIVNMR